MSFAYIEGQEAVALDFFEKRLQQAANPGEREQLAALVERLKQKLLEHRKDTSAGDRARVLAGGMSNAA
jgi:hypothetical protein